MARQRLNNQAGTLGAALSTVGQTAFTFAVAPGFPTIVSPDYYAITIEPGTTNEEIVRLTAFTAAATTGTVSRGQDGSTAVTHANGVAWVHAPGVYDFLPAANVFNIKEYGAKCDGVTDDTAAINAAIAAAPANSTIEFPPGNILVSTPMVISLSGIRLRGAGRFATVFWPTATFGTNGVQRGVFSFTGGGALLTGCAVEDMGCDFTHAPNNETTINALSFIFQDTVPLNTFRAARLYAYNTQYTNGILLNGLAQGVGSYDIGIDDIYTRNGGMAVGVFGNGKQVAGLLDNVRVRNVVSLIDSLVNDDRIIIAAGNGGTGNTEVRNVMVENVITKITVTTALVNGVKLDTGTNGYMHDVVINNVFMDCPLAASVCIPVYMQSSGGTGSVGLENWVVSNVYGRNTNRLRLYHYRNASANTLQSKCEVRNVKLANCLDTMAAVEIYSPQGSSDEMCTISGVAADTGVTASGQFPIGIMLTCGANTTQGMQWTSIRDCSFRNFKWAVANNVSEANAIITTGWNDVYIERTQLGWSGGMNAAPWSLTNTYRIRDCPGYSPVGHAVTQPAVPATTVAQTNSTGVDCMVHVAGGTVTVIAVGGTATGLTSGSFRVPAWQTITLTYSVAPTWQWFGD